MPSNDAEIIKLQIDERRIEQSADDVVRAAERDIAVLSESLDGAAETECRKEETAPGENRLHPCYEQDEMRDDLQQAELTMTSSAIDDVKAPPLEFNDCAVSEVQHCSEIKVEHKRGGMVNHERVRWTQIFMRTRGGRNRRWTPSCEWRGGHETGQRRSATLQAEMDGWWRRPELQNDRLSGRSDGASRYCFAMTSERGSQRVQGFGRANIATRPRVGSGRPNWKVNNGLCWLCGGPHHVARFCPNRRTNNVVERATRTLRTFPVISSTG